MSIYHTTVVQTWHVNWCVFINALFIGQLGATLCRLQYSDKKMYVARPNKQTCCRATYEQLQPFVIGGNEIEFVTRWSHLGHVINIQLTDDDDVELIKAS